MTGVFVAFMLLLITFGGAATLGALIGYVAFGNLGGAVVGGFIGWALSEDWQ